MAHSPYTYGVGSYMFDIGGILGGIGSLVGGISEGVANAENLKLQKQQLAYQKWVQQHSWSREDNAVQRRVADLRAAGLSPVLAAGSAAQSSPAQVLQAPQQNPGSAGAAARGVSQGMQTMLALNQAAAVISRTKAEERLLQMQARKADAEASLTEARVPFAENLAISEDRQREWESLEAGDKARMTAMQEAVMRYLSDTTMEGERTRAYMVGAGHPENILGAQARANAAYDIARAALAGHEERAYNILKGLGAGNETIRTILSIVQTFMGRR